MHENARLTPSSAPVAPSTRLGDWYATIVPYRTSLVLAMSELMLLSVLLPVAPAHSLVKRLPESLGAILLAWGLPDDLVGREVDAMRDPAIGVTASRQIVGCLLEAVATARWSGAPRSPSEVAAVRLSDRM